MLLAPGGFWVGGFFVLSGFCIALSLRRTIESGGYSKKVFVLQRVTRIYPLYLAGLAVSIGVFFFLEDGSFPWKSFVANLLSLQGFVAEPFPYYDPSWSIAYEMVYYFLVPLFLSSVRPNLKKYFWLISVVLICTAFIFGLTWKVVLDEPVWMIPLWTVPWSGLLWIIGFGGVVYSGPSSPIKLSFLLRPSFAVAIVILCLCYIYRTVGLMSGWSSAIRFLSGPMVGYGFLLLVLSLPKWSELGSVRLKAFSQWSGLLSYPLYLFHMPLQAIIFKVCEFFQVDSLVLVFLFLILVPFVICGSLGVTMEKEILKWRKNWLARSISTPNPRLRGED